MVPQIELDKYKIYLKECAKDYDTRIIGANDELHMSVLMSVMFEYTKNIARIYCHDFNERMITNQPYWNALRRFLREGKSIRILCDTRKAEKEVPIHLLRMEKKSRSGTDLISVKVITGEDKSKILESVAEDHYKFSVFDENKFVAQYSEDENKAFASFNRPDACKFLIKLFDTAFKNSKEIIV